jgi:hypothetical protein
MSQTDDAGSQMRIGRPRHFDGRSSGIPPNSNAKLVGSALPDCGLATYPNDAGKCHISSQINWIRRSEVAYAVKKLERVKGMEPSS